METGGLTPFALIFMLVSMGTVTALMVYCFYRILAQPGGVETVAARKAERREGEDDGSPPAGRGG